MVSGKESVSRLTGMHENDMLQPWELVLYVAGKSPNCVRAFSNLTQVCERHLPGHCSIELIDLWQEPRKAARDNVTVIPTLVRRRPMPVKKIEGDLTNMDLMLHELGLPDGA
jgi:circadian clock protein KaiB